MPHRWLCVTTLVLGLTAVEIASAAAGVTSSTTLSPVSELLVCVGV